MLTSFLSDFGPRQIENAAMLCSSWQRPPMMIDPNGEGSVWLGKLNKLMNKKKLVSLDMETRCVRANWHKSKSWLKESYMHERKRERERGHKMYLHWKLINYVLLCFHLCKFAVVLLQFNVNILMFKKVMHVWICYILKIPLIIN